MLGLVFLIFTFALFYLVGAPWWFLAAILLGGLMALVS